MPRLPLCSALLLAAALAACATPLPPLPPTPVLVFGEQHDQPDHQRQVAAAVAALAREGRLGAVVLEMAERGRSTAGLPREADAARVREALAWSGWEWPVYEAVVMAAVRAGVPVLGGNLPRARQREAMADAALEGSVDERVRARLADAVREGHCGLLPAAQEPGMLRIQIARDTSMAQTLAEAAPSASRQLLLLTGAQHAARDRGVPLQLARLSPQLGVHVVIFGDAAPDLLADTRQPARSTPRPDPCEGLREQLAKPKPPPAASAPAP